MVHSYIIVSELIIYLDWIKVGKLLFYIIFLTFDRLKICNIFIKYRHKHAAIFHCKGYLSVYTATYLRIMHNIFIYLNNCYLS